MAHSKRGTGGGTHAAAPWKMTPLTLSPEERRRMIAETAYYLAERRAFQGGDPVRDWLDAEAQIDEALTRSPM